MLELAHPNISSIHEQLECVKEPSLQKYVVTKQVWFYVAAVGLLALLGDRECGTVVLPASCKTKSGTQ